MTSEYIETANRNWSKISSAIGAGLAYLSGLELANSQENFWHILGDQPLTIVVGLVTAVVAAWKTGRTEQGKISAAADRAIARSVARVNGDLDDDGDDA